MKIISRTFFAPVSVLLALTLLFAPVSSLLVGVAGVSFAEPDDPSVLFETSFEEDEAAVSGAVLEAVNVIKADYGMKGKGLEIRFETLKGSEDYIGSESKFNLFDGKTATKFLTDHNTSVVWFALKTPAAVNSYEVASANDAPERDPKAWTLYGSNDGKTWTALDTQTGVSFSGRYKVNRYSFENDVVYEWFKLDVTKNAGSGMTQYSSLELYADGVGADPTPDEPEKGEGMTARKDIGPLQTDNGKAGSWSGLGCLAVYGQQSAKENTHARSAVFEDLNVPVSADTTLSYLIFPALFKNKVYDYEYTSCRVMIDLHFTDGTRLGSLAARDQNGSLMTPEGQVEGECLYTAQWNYVESKIGAVAAGRTVDRIEVWFDMASAEDASPFVTFFDDLKIENKTDPVYEHLSDYITILRGTNNDQAFSRGLCTPGVTMPNGFNFYSPITNPEKSTASYNYQQNGNNNPMDSFTVIHIPSMWLSSYGTWQFMPNVSEDLTGTVSSDMISSDARASKFSHENEIARAHYYSVTMNEGTPASGVKVEITPTDHAAYVRFTFPESAEHINVIFDSIWGSGSLKFSDDHRSFSATTNHTSAGNTTMHIYGEFDKEYTHSSVVSNKKGAAVFPAGTTVLTMKISTSFISLKQAQHSMDLEIADKDFEGVFAEAQSAWDALCGKFEIEGATYTQLVNFYSSVYRMYAYPNLYSENEGTNEEPKWVYASPYKNGRKQSGILYTINGFWDTYRTTWAGYSLFTAEKDSDLLNGLVQHYIDSGWVPRWICPGGVDCMVGTSSDIIFADAYIKGIDFNYEKAWESMIENASAFSQDMSAGGRPDNNKTPFLGYVANTTTQGYSSSMESYINDYGLYRMAEKMGKKDEAEYYLNSCLKYPELFNAECGFFMGKNEKGVFSANARTYSPNSWGGPKEDYTESVGWVNAFPAVFDPEGLVALYGGREALAEKLNKMFDDSPASMRKVVSEGVHEIAEFKEVRMGQYEHNNQPAHHIIYTYAFSSEPWHVQEYTREVLRHVYVGSEIGQGFPGDEDNGEMSAWFVFNALGFYPYCLASGEYVIGSPLFDKVTVHLDNGNDIVIIARSNSQENVYIQSAKVNGEAYDKMYLPHELLTAGCTIEYEMGSEPSAFGTSDEARPASVTDGNADPYIKNVTNGVKPDVSDYDGSLPESGKKIFTTITGASTLLDGNSNTAADLTSGDVLTFVSGDLSEVSILTLASYDRKSAPKGVKIEVSNDGAHFKTVYENKSVSFKFNRFVIPFSLPEEMRGKYFIYRVTLTGGKKLAEIELLGEEKPLDENEATAFLDFFASSEETQKQTPKGSLFRRDVTVKDEINLTDLTALLNLLAGNLK